MSAVHVVGIDPGLVHTGVVSMRFNRAYKRIDVAHVAIDGPDAQATKDWIGDKFAFTFIEGYRPRSNFSTDQRMVSAITDFKRETGGTILMNTGVKKVVKSPLMELLGVWKFSTVTHHQDLRSAARIALLGMLKDDHLNKLLTDVVADHLEGKDWHVYSN
jgi:hypothetical protein